MSGGVGRGWDVISRTRPALSALTPPLVTILIWQGVGMYKCTRTRRIRTDRALVWLLVHPHPLYIVCARDLT